MTLEIPQPLLVASWHRYGGYAMSAATSAAGSGAWPTADKAFYQPFYFPASFTIAALCIANTSTAGTCSLALYNSSGTRLVTTGSFSLPGSAKVTSVAVSYVVTRGTYYVGCSMNGGGSLRMTPGIPMLRLAGAAVQTSAHPLPATATFSQIDADYLPLVGVAITAPP